MCWNGIGRDVRKMSRSFFYRLAQSDVASLCQNGSTRHRNRVLAPATHTVMLSFGIPSSQPVAAANFSPCCLSFGLLHVGFSRLKLCLWLNS